MTRKVRFGQQTQSGDPAGIGELMPLRYSYRPEAKARDNPLKKFADKRTASKRFGRAPVRVDDPFDSIHNVACSYSWAWPHSAQNLLIFGIGFPQLRQNFVSAPAPVAVVAPATGAVPDSPLAGPAFFKASIIA
jgi:hypothetical protein